MAEVRDSVVLVWPDGADFDERASILEREKANLEAGLRMPVRLARTDPGTGRRWVCRIDPGLEAPALIRSGGEVIESVGRTGEDLWSTFSLRHTWLWLGGEVRAEDAADLADAVGRIAMKWPSPSRVSPSAASTGPGSAPNTYLRR